MKKPILVSLILFNHPLNALIDCLGYWCLKGSSFTFPKSLKVWKNEANEWLCLVGFSTVRFVQCFDTVAWTTGKAPLRNKWRKKTKEHAPHVDWWNPGLPLHFPLPHFLLYLLVSFTFSFSLSYSLSISSHSTRIVPVRVRPDVVRGD